MHDGESSTSDKLPRIELRVPGPWRSPMELEDAQGKAGTPPLSDDGLVHVSTGRMFHAGTSPHDDEIHELFEHTGRLSDSQVERIASHTVKIHVSGPGGAAPAAPRGVGDGTGAEGG